jgi:hypothetical protein
MRTDIEQPAGDDALTEFIEFANVVNAQQDAYWPAMAPMSLPLLKGEGPEAIGRHMQPFVARRDGEIVARALAVVDEHYLGRWDDGVGHISMFEALPHTRDDVCDLMTAACGWLRDRGMRAARAGFGISDFPFRIDGDDTLPPVLLRNNPNYYHSLLKEAGFESERAWTDYRAEVTPENIERWKGCVVAAEARGFRLVPYGEVPVASRAKQWVETWNESFHDHWGVAPQTEDEHTTIASFLQGFGMGETSVMAFEGDDPVGCCWVVPELASSLASRTRDLRSEELVNFLGIAVRKKARRKGVNTAIASYSFLKLVERGASHVSYTLVLDDNWPSRRTAEKLGAHICGNYMVYRRNFGS